MKTILNQKITQILQQDFNLEVDAAEIELDKPIHESQGELTTNVALKFAKKLNLSPRELGQQIATKLEEAKIADLSSLEVAGPGFINFRFAPEYYLRKLQEISKDADFGKGKVLDGKRIMIEFAHPNPFKSFHIGHLRNIILGESIVRLIESQGAEVIRVNYQGDVGMHIAKCLWAMRQVDRSEFPTDADARVKFLGECYAKGAAAFEESEATQSEIKEVNKLIYTRSDETVNELWDLGKKWSLEKFQQIYSRLSTSFVRQYMESEVLDLAKEKVALAVEKGILKQDDGAVIFDGKSHGLDTRVFMNSQGFLTYEGKELGLAYMEFNDYGKIDLCIHNVAVEQISFFKVTFKVQELLDPELFAGKQYHNAYEFVGLTTGKMSSRKGQVVLGWDVLEQTKQKLTELVTDRSLDVDIVEKLTVAAVKYAFLRISPFTYLAFNVEESVNINGDSGLYLMYAYTRAKSVLKKAEEGKLDANYTPDKEEAQLINQLASYPEIVAKAAAEYSPHYVTGYLLDLAQGFNNFYHAKSILNAEQDAEKTFRIELTNQFARVMDHGMQLLGINSVEQM